MNKLVMIGAALLALTVAGCAGDRTGSTQGLLLENTGRIKSDSQQADACTYWRNIRESEVQSDTAMGPLPGLEGGARLRILRQRALRDCPEGTHVPAATEQKDEAKPDSPPA